MTESDLSREVQPDLTWEENVKLLSRGMRSRRFISILFGVSILITVTAGIAFQVVFLFSVLRAFFALSIVNQRFYSAVLSILKYNQLPPVLPKPPKSAYFTSGFYLAIAVLFLYVGILIIQATGFCAQSVGCVIVQAIQSTTSNK